MDELPADWLPTYVLCFDSTFFLFFFFFSLSLYLTLTDKNLHFWLFLRKLEDLAIIGLHDSHCLEMISGCI